ncbi:MAG TPA: hypothetical protein VK961_06945 [Chthoniobacter sp.]|nr:hypothetical protein [Chthoniobacter sp.]
MLNIIAESLPPPAAEELYSWLKCVVCAAGIYLLFLKIYQGHKRQPPVEEEFKRIDEKVMQKFEAVKVTIMPREEIEGEVARLDQYVHDFRHEIRTDLQALGLKVDESNETVGKAMQTMRSELEQRRSQGIGSLHQQLKGAEVELGAVKKEATLHTAQITQLDQKIDRMPEKIIALLNSHKRS